MAKDNFKSIAFLTGASMVIKKFVDLCQTDISFGTVWNVIDSECNYSNYSLKNINRILNTWGFETLAARIKPKLLSELEYPVISHIIENGEEEFIILTKYSGEYIHYIKSCNNERKESISSFLKKWQGIILMAQCADLIREQEYEYKRSLDEKMKEEYVNKNLFVSDDFFSQEQCEQLIQASRNLFQRSTVTGNGTEHIISHRRTSQSAFLRELDEKFKQDITNKCIRLLGNRPYHEFEGIQCVCYQIGEEFKAHFDAGKGMKRLYTILVYLNENIEGGETYFPMLDLKIKPKTGRAVLFHNLDHSGSIDRFSFHAGLPVKNGEKIACNIWIR